MANRRSFKGGIKGYWKKRASNYALRRAPPTTIVLGSATVDDKSASSGPPRRRFWRIPRRIRFLKRIGSPKRWLARLRDAYVNMMLRLANSAALGYGGYGYGYGGADVAFGARRLKEYDENMLVEIYKNLLISQGGVGVVSAEASVMAVRS